MKNKKGLAFVLPPLLIVILCIILVAGLIWFSFRIDNIVSGLGFLSPFLSFIGKWWWAIAIAIFFVTPVGQAVLKFLLSKIGIKV